jgi:3'-phosphoadenosine 5'-phosphosulfate sulfotransferase (PAPS reductase)/FAD synthetase
MKNILNVSGGKDSTAMLLWAIERDTPDMSCVFADTGNEHPLTYEYIDYLERRLGITIQRVKADCTHKLNTRRKNLPERWRAAGISEERIRIAVENLQPTGVPFLDMALSEGRFPSKQMRFCTTRLKIDALKKQVFLPLLEAGEDVDSWQGIRKDESKARALYPEREHKITDEKTGAELWMYRPILDWKAEDTFEIMKRHMVAPNPLYKLGMGRVGCMPCVMCRKSELAQIAARFPDQIDRIREWERKINLVSKGQDATFFPTANNRGAGIDEVVEWSKTDRGGHQFGLFNDWDDLPACSSEYGLCE